MAKKCTPMAIRKKELNAKLEFGKFEIQHSLYLSQSKDVIELDVTRGLSVFVFKIVCVLKLKQIFMLNVIFDLFGQVHYMQMFS